MKRFKKIRRGGAIAVATWIAIAGASSTVEAAITSKSTPSPDAIRQITGASSLPLPWSLGWLNDLNQPPTVQELQHVLDRQQTPELPGSGGPWAPFAGFANPIFTSAAPGNNGLPTFVAVTADVNHDGLPDLVTAQIDGTLNILLNPGSANFSTISLTSTNSSAADSSRLIYWLSVADLNRDGYPDIVATDYGTTSAVVFSNDTQGGFNTAVVYPFTFTDGATLNFYSGNGGNVLVGDVTGDSIPDLVAFAINPTTDAMGITTTAIHYQVRPGNGDGTFGAAGPDQITQFDGYAVNYVSQVALVDMNHDGKLDLVAELGGFDNSGNPHVVLFAALGSGAGTFNGVPTSFSASPNGRVQAMDGVLAAYPNGNLQILDANGDGNPDVFFSVVDWNTGYTHIHRALGKTNGGFQAPTESLGGWLLGLSQNFSFVDMDGDGIVDLVAYADENVAVFKGAADGTFNSTPLDRWATSNNIAQVAQPADFDRDGKLDIVQVGVDSAAGFFLSSEGLLNGTQARNTSLSGPGENSFVYPVGIGHIAGAGSTDVMLASYNPVNDDHYFGYYLESASNDGHGHFTYRTALTAGQLWAVATRKVMAKGDFNDDGQLDILLTTANGLAMAWSNGDGTYGDPVSIPLGETLQCQPNLADVGDLNNDGHTDIVVAYPGDAYCTSVSGGVPSGLFALLGDGQGGFTPVFTPYGNKLFTPKLADFDGDGNLDVVVNEIGFFVNPSQSNLYVIPGNGDGSFDIARANTVVSAPVVAAIIPGDFDGDGKQDLTVGLFAVTGAYQGDPSNMGVYQLKGNGDFTFAPLVLGSQLPSTLGLVVADGQYADLNGDGFPDLVLAVKSHDGFFTPYLSSTFAYLLNNGSNGFGPLQQTFGPVDTPYPEGYRHLFVANFSGGAPEILIDTGYGTQLYKNLSDTIFVNGFGGD